MLSNPEFTQSNLMPFLGLLGASMNKNSNNPFLGIMNNVLQMQMLQNLNSPTSNAAAPQPPIHVDTPLLSMASSNAGNVPASIPSQKNLMLTPTPPPEGLLSQGVSAIKNIGQGANDIVSRIAHAIGMVESSNNYKALGPQTKNGDRAYGKYQVMGNNIPVWTREVLGQSLTPQQFLSNQQAQDQVALAKMGQYHKRFGTPHDVASMWFSGRPASNNFSKDVTGTSVPTYMKRVLSYMR